MLPEQVHQPPVFVVSQPDRGRFDRRHPARRIVIAIGFGMAFALLVKAL
jgi:hypothetical protein